MLVAAYNKAISAWKAGNDDVFFISICGVIRIGPSKRRHLRIVKWAHSGPILHSLPAERLIETISIETISIQLTFMETMMPTMTAATHHVPSPSIVFNGRPLDAISDEECLTLLAEAVDEHDASHLEEVARLISRLAIPIEL